MGLYMHYACFLEGTSGATVSRKRRPARGGRTLIIWVSYAFVIRTFEGGRRAGFTISRC